MISFIIPCHNEEKFLPYSLKPLLEYLDTNDEIIFVLDRCTDKTETIINWFKQKCKAHVRIVYKNSKFFYEHPVVDVYFYGIHFATNNRIVQLGADVVINKKVLNIIKHFNNTPFKFQMIEYRNHFRYAYHKFLSFFVKSYCLEVYERSQMYKIPRFDFVLTIDMLIQNLLIEPLSQFYKINVPVLHLRSYLRDKSLRFISGFKRAFLKYSFIKTLLYSILFNRPEVLVGYLYFKFRESKLREYIRRRLRENLERRCECRLREASINEQQTVYTC